MKTIIAVKSTTAGRTTGNDRTDSKGHDDGTKNDDSARERDEEIDWFRLDLIGVARQPSHQARSRQLIPTSLGQA